MKISCQPWMCRWIKKAATTATKKRAATQLVTNNVESGIGDLKSVAGHQAEQADSLLTIEAMKYSANKTGEVRASHRKVVGPRQVRCKAFSVRFDGGRKMRPLRILTCVWQRSHLKKGDLVHGRLGSIEVKQHARYDGFADTQASKVFPTSKARAAS